ncbi:MAG: hypothetical protein O3A81_00585 [bacterium]|nr:hypothetical protein [bacterium]
MKNTCTQCSAEFEILDEDSKMLDDLSPIIGGKKIPLPPPKQCPNCRAQRRMAHVNQLNLYERKCDLTGASVISNIRPGSPYKVYRQEDWYSDKWSALDYGQPFDFTRPFFDQWFELIQKVPRPNVFTGYEFDENCEYTNHAGKNKDCYMIFDSDENRDCYFSYSLNHCVNCVDCFRTRKSELCYECIDSVKCYSSAYLQECDNCADSMFLKNCTGCKNCLMCSNVKNKEYYVENKPVSKEEFAKFRLMLGSHSTLQSAKERFENLKLEHPQKYLHGVQNEDVSGDYLVQCKNAYKCFDSEDLWDCRYVTQGFMPLKNCMDIHECGEGELLYECSVAGYDISRCLFSNHTLAQMNDMIYCSLSNHSKNCFGCIGVQRKQYCILNKQYTEEQYNELVPKIIEHMIKHGEWGEFFPVEVSTYGYNETLAQDYYPMTKEGVLGKSWNWIDEVEKKDQYMGPKVKLPDSIVDVSEDICSQILTCEETAKQYKIIPQELAFYKQLHIPLPRISFFQRYKHHLKMRNPRVLYDRTCDKCNVAIETSYAPDRPEKIYCEPCYQESLI